MNEPWAVPPNRPPSGPELRKHQDQLRDPAVAKMDPAWVQVNMMAVIAGHLDRIATALEELAQK